MNGCTCGTFEEIVDGNGDKEFVFAVAIKVDETFVGVDNVFEVDWRLRHEGEAVVVVGIAVDAKELLNRSITFEGDAGKDTA